MGRRVSWELESWSSHLACAAGAFHASGWGAWTFGGPQSHDVKVLCFWFFSEIAKKIF